MSLPILLTQLRIANVRTLAAVAHDSGPSPVAAQHAAPLQGRAAPSLGSEVDAQRDAPQVGKAAAPLAPWEVNWCEPVALLVGNEGAGLPEEVERSADARIRIPMASGVESLNAAAAAAVLFYEAARQRSKQIKDTHS
jgi:hypothetical protein